MTRAGGRAANGAGTGRTADATVGVRDDLDFDVPAQTDAIAGARHAVVQHLARHGVPSTVVDDIELVTSELVTNAIIHPPRVAGDGSVQVHIGLTDAIEVRVANHGSAAAIPPVDQWRPAPAKALSGRGLGIVRRLSDAVTVEQVGAHAIVTCRRRLPDGGVKR